MLKLIKDDVNAKRDTVVTRNMIGNAVADLAGGAKIRPVVGQLTLDEECPAAIAVPQHVVIKHVLSLAAICDDIVTIHNKTVSIHARLTRAFAPVVVSMPHPRVV
jgi:hypothetical protein